MCGLFKKCYGKLSLDVAKVCNLSLSYLGYLLKQSMNRSIEEGGEPLLHRFLCIWSYTRRLTYIIHSRQGIYTQPSVTTSTSAMKASLCILQPRKNSPLH